MIYLLPDTIGSATFIRKISDNPKPGQIIFLTKDEWEAAQQMITMEVPKPEGEPIPEEYTL